MIFSYAANACLSGCKTKFHALTNSPASTAFRTWWTFPCPIPNDYLFTPKRHASLFSKFSLLWCKPEKQRLLHLHHSKDFICFCKSYRVHELSPPTQCWSGAPVRATTNIHCAEDIWLGFRGIQPRTSAPKPIYLSIWWRAIHNNKEFLTF